MQSQRVPRERRIAGHDSAAVTWLRAIRKISHSRSNTMSYTLSWWGGDNDKLLELRGAADH